MRLAADNLNQVGAVTLTTPDGIVLRSTPVAIALYNAESGESAILAGLRDCQGVLVSSNQVAFESAFNENGVLADVVFTIEAGTFSQEIVFRAPLKVSDYGFPEKTTRIQILTEFYGSSQPDKVTRPIRVEQDKTARGRMATRGSFTDDRTGQTSQWICYPAIANWHSQFLAAWIAQNKGLVEAITQANQLAMSPGSMPAPDNGIETEIAPAVTIPFNPSTCLRVYGYRDLHFNQYNHASDWP